MSGWGQGMSTGIWELDTAASGLGTSWQFLPFCLTSILGRISILVPDRYLITMTMRRDGSSLSFPKVIVSKFPSVSVGWNIAEEKFVKDHVEWLNELKLKAGYGELVVGSVRLSVFFYNNGYRFC